MSGLRSWRSNCKARETCIACENQKVKGWLLTSMSPEIMKHYLRLPTSHGIWNALAKAFYDGADESHLFALNQRAFSTKQVGHPISTYYGDLREIFQELDHHDKIVMNDPDDVFVYKKSVERLRVHIFLNGLDEEFEQIHGEILRRDSVLDLEETYAYPNHKSVNNLGKTSSSIATAGNEGQVSPQRENNDEVKTSINHADNLDIIAHGNQLIDPLDNVETNDECPINENIDHQDREEYTSDARYGSDGPEIIHSNQDTLEVPTVSHNVPVNQLSSLVDSILESHVNPSSELLKELPN
ncbi:hypothetical protein DKX38_017593 [Salix brachista]|uniref:Retrotransposon gag domain-containing protein n=1 Tax=Salix brachista TaxID=2182728 RepID=A0A5N5KVS4_9ROSI|nr:hypothetical protein DKX38_017593 [Salix brachista]